MITKESLQQRITQLKEQQAKIETVYTQLGRERHLIEGMITECGNIHNMILANEQAAIKQAEVAKEARKKPGRKKAVTTETSTAVQDDLVTDKDAPTGDLVDVSADAEDLSDAA